MKGPVVNSLGLLFTSLVSKTFNPNYLLHYFERPTSTLIQEARAIEEETLSAFTELSAFFLLLLLFKFLLVYTGNTL
jgi:hypothetical protein